MTEPPFLKSGSTIGIVSTARKISYEEMENALGLLADEGFKVITGQHMFGADHQFSGTDAERVADMQRMLDDEEVKAILCSRGGYGSVRIIDRLDFSNFLQHPKWICGYSDVTVFHNHLHQQWGVSSLHCTMPVNLQQAGADHPAFRTMIDSLTGNLPSFKFDAHPLQRNGIAEALVVGGNLSMLYSMLGSPSSISTAGKILFIEDLDEYLYHVDRMMMNLKRNGYLDDLAGLLIGGMTDMNDNTVQFGKTAVEIIAEHVEAYDYPVAFNFPAGHLDDNRALILSKKAALHVSESGSSLTYV